MEARLLRRTLPRDAKRMFAAIAKGSDMELRQLIDSGVDVNLCHQGTTPILECLRNNRLELAETLIQAGADLTILDHKGRSVTFAAVQKNSVEFLTLFIEHGLKGDKYINGEDIHGMTPLLLAMETPGGDECMKCLLVNGANIDVSNRRKKSPLQCAIESGSPDKVKLLLMYKPNPKLEMYKDLIYFVTINNSVSMQKMTDELISYGFTIPKERVKDFHFADFAVKTHSVKLLEYLFTVLRYSKQFYSHCELLAHQTQNLQIQRLLVTFRKQFRRNSWVIEDAVICDDASRVKEIIMSGSKKRKLSTLIYLAVVQSSVRVLEFLLEYKRTEFNVNNKFGRHHRPPYGVRRNVKIAREFVSHFGVDQNGEFLDNNLVHFAADSNAWKTFEVLRKYGADLNITNERGDTPLNIAWKRRHFRSVEKLLELGGDINLLNSEGRTPPGLLGIGFYPRVYAYIIKHIMSIHFAGFFINDLNLALMNNSVKGEMFRRLKNEVDDMKSTIINGTTVSYYKVLSSSEAELDTLLNNELIVNALDSEFKNRFKNFTNLMCLRLQSGLKRREICSYFLNTHPSFRQLPYLCLDKIFSYFTTEDLGIMAGYYSCRIHIPCPIPEIDLILEHVRGDRGW